MIRYTTTHEPGVPTKTECWIGIVVRAEILPNASETRDVALQLTTLTNEHLTISFSAEALQSLYRGLRERYESNLAVGSEVNRG